jgi:hypothetical protein
VAIATTHSLIKWMKVALCESSGKSAPTDENLEEWSEPDEGARQSPEQMLQYLVQAGPLP